MILVTSVNDLCNSSANFTQFPLPAPAGKLYGRGELYKTAGQSVLPQLPQLPHKFYPQLVIGQPFTSCACRLAVISKKREQGKKLFIILFNKGTAQDSANGRTLIIFDKRQKNDICSACAQSSWSLFCHGFPDYAAFPLL